MLALQATIQLCSPGYSSNPGQFRHANAILVSQHSIFYPESRTAFWRESLFGIQPRHLSWFNIIHATNGGSLVTAYSSLFFLVQQLMK